jgi:flagellar hook-length control protein FliK
MNCTDVQTLARAAPEPANPPKVNMGDVGNSFDQFLQAVSTDRPTGADASPKTVSSKRETGKDNFQPEKEKPVDNKPVDQKPSNEKKVTDKPVAEKKTEALPADQENGQVESIDESAMQAMAAVLAAQAAAAAAPVQLADGEGATGETVETVVPPAVVPVMENAQSTVIQLPETEPQPLPDELKQAIQQPKVEVKDFQALVNNAAQNLENPVAATSTDPVVMAATTQVSETPELQNLNTQEPTIKVVDVAAQPEDLAEIDSNRTAASVYSMTSAKPENLVQPKALPIIQKVSTEVAELVREQGQSMRLQIHPENLGKIDLRLVSNSDGMKVVMTAEVPATAKLLEAHMDQLRQSLSNAGVSISGMSVNSQGAQGQPDNAGPGQSLKGQMRLTSTAIQPDVETASAATVQVGSSSLDYRI